MAAAARKVFDQYDVDGDGQVTAEEYRKVVEELGESGITTEAAQDFIDSLDSDGDRTVSFEEFRASMGI
ncbi:EF-hand domain-containing protein [Streptomyces sp. HNM0574]|uniref:EF-hand domain-containing protein n=1 Tax=Streptomyces sp. HNM0574 TaxID=2714954 RepID=UPI00146D7960|nr:EF-hand domain-containing protein [Streptomyces sp. HNM0574]NLU69452.1 EF-hand domain-containing protein [Streptomyces sp. HNM0574]